MAAAGSEAGAWLRQMAQAVQSLNYVGTFVYQHPSGLEAMRIVHASENGVEHEKLSSLTGPVREVIRDNRMVTCVLGDRRAVMVSQSRPRQPFPAGFARDIRGLSDYYEFRMGARDRVAGIVCQEVEVAPRDAYRYGHRLCIDAERRMLLRARLTEPDGTLIEEVMFTDIRYPEDIDEALLQPSLDESGLRWVREPRHADSPAPADWRSRWVVQQLPPGFAMTDHSHHQFVSHGPNVEHWVYSDGLASVSVYIEKMRDQAGGDAEGVSRRGALNAFGTRVAGHYVTVVGEVPRATVELIGRSVRYRP